MEIKSLNDINRIRARYAYEKIEEFICKSSDEENEKLRSYARKIPMLILNNGLINTIYFLKNKSISENGSKEYKVIYNAIVEWEGIKSHKVDEIEKDILVMNNSEYQSITREILELSTWLKKAAEAMIESEQD